VVAAWRYGGFCLMTDPMKPPSTLLAKLGSIVHNALLLTGTDHDQYLLGELEKHRHDPEVMQWMAGMDRLNLLPHTS
jgi:hypothetical protein